MDSGKKNRDVFRALALLTQLGIGMIVPIVLCLLIGRWLDSLLGTGFIVIIFLVLGILAAYRNLYMYARPLLKGQRERENEAFWKSRTPQAETEKDAGDRNKKEDCSGDGH